MSRKKKGGGGREGKERFQNTTFHENSFQIVPIHETFKNYYFKSDLRRFRDNQTRNNNTFEIVFLRTYIYDIYYIRHANEHLRQPQVKLFIVLRNG